MKVQRIRTAPAKLLAESTDFEAVLVQLDSKPRRPVDGRPRQLVCYAVPDVARRRLAAGLRELADRLDEAAT